MKVKLNLQLEETMKEYVKQQADKMGISINGFVNVALSQYKDQKDMLLGLPDLVKVIVDMQENEQKSGGVLQLAADPRNGK